MKYVSKDSIQTQLRFIDLFAGIGGFRIAWERNNALCVFSSEWNKYARETYAVNFGDEPSGDITQIDEKDVPDHDVLVAGFPCQPFSLAGVSKKNSLGRKHGFEDTQGTLFFDVCRILKEKRPKAFMLENVKNLRSHDNGKTFEVILDALDELDYKVFHTIVEGKKYVPQHRERIVIIGFDKKRYGNDINFSFKLQPPEEVQKLRDILEKDVGEKYTLKDRTWAYLQEYRRKHEALGNGFGYTIADPEGTTRTLSARYHKDGSEILIEQEGKNPRRLTPRECARLMGFEDSFKIPVSDTQAYHQFGNSIVVPLMTDVARLVTEKINELDSLVSEPKK